MRITIDTATDSVKEAEHAIVVIGALYGLTTFPNVGADETRVSGATPLPLVIPAQPAANAPSTPTTGLVYSGAPAPLAGVPLPNLSAMPMPGASLGAPDMNPTAAFGTPGMPTMDPTAAFGAAGNGAGVAAPSTVAVNQSPSAQGGPLAGVQMPMPGLPANAPQPGAMEGAHSGSVAPTSHANGVELDKEGLPWDSRIHASTKTKTVKGEWKAKKGINDDAMVARVKAELRATLAITPPAQQQAAAPAPFVPPAASSPHVPPVAASAPAEPANFEQLMPRITAAMHAQQLPDGALLAACTAYQLPSINALAVKPEMVPYIWALLKQTYPLFAAAVA